MEDNEIINEAAGASEVNDAPEVAEVPEVTAEVTAEVAPEVAAEVAPEPAAEKFVPFVQQNHGPFENVTVPQPTNQVAAADGGTINHQTGEHKGEKLEPLSVNHKTGEVRGVVAGIRFDLPKR